MVLAGSRSRASGGAIEAGNTGDGGADPDGTRWRGLRLAIGADAGGGVLHCLAHALADAAGCRGAGRAGRHRRRDRARTGRDPRLDLGLPWPADAGSGAAARAAGRGAGGRRGAVRLWPGQGRRLAGRDPAGDAPAPGRGGAYPDRGRRRAGGLRPAVAGGAAVCAGPPPGDALDQPGGAAADRHGGGLRAGLVAVLGADRRVSGPAVPGGCRCLVRGGRRADRTRHSPAAEPRQDRQPRLAGALGRDGALGPVLRRPRPDGPGDRRLQRAGRAGPGPGLCRAPLGRYRAGARRPGAGRTDPPERFRAEVAGHRRPRRHRLDGPGRP